MGGGIISDVQFFFILVSISYYFYNTYVLHNFKFFLRKKDLIIEPQRSKI